MINLVALGALIALSATIVSLLDRDYRKKEKEWKEYLESFFEEKKQEEEK